jgi:hypothetical protein
MKLLSVLLAIVIGTGMVLAQDVEEFRYGSQKIKNSESNTWFQADSADTIQPSAADTLLSKVYTPLDVKSSIYVLDISLAKGEDDSITATLFMKEGFDYNDLPLATDIITVTTNTSTFDTCISLNDMLPTPCVQFGWTSHGGKHFLIDTFEVYVQPLE